MCVELGPEGVGRSVCGVVENVAVLGVYWLTHLTVRIFGAHKLGRIKPKRIHVIPLFDWNTTVQESDRDVKG